jgi:hypothetical protein
MASLETGALASSPGFGPSLPELDPEDPDDPDDPEDPPDEELEPDPEEDDAAALPPDEPPPYGCPVESVLLPQAAIVPRRPRAATIQYRSPRA